jgi:hypothetical protein
MRLQPFIVPLLAAAAVASGCATPDSRYGSNDTRYARVYSNENMYAVIDAIEAIRRNKDENHTLQEVVGHYDAFLELGLSDQEKASLIEYLKSL